MTSDENSNIGSDVPKALTHNREFKISFKTPKGEDGKPATDELGNPIPKKPSFVVTVPVPSLDGVLASLRDEKQREYILDLIAQDVYRGVRAQINDATDAGKEIKSSDDLDFSKLTIEYFANQPPAERRGGGIAKEVWEDWGKDYLAVMPGATGKTVEKVETAMTLFIKKFQPVKTNKKILAVLQEQLATWAATTGNLEDFLDVYEFLNNKIEVLLQQDEAALLEAL
jgi:hypothetical protein